MLARDEAEISHQFPRMRKTAKITEFSDDSQGGEKVDAT
jgi:hypothetical protein